MKTWLKTWRCLLTISLLFAVVWPVNVGQAGARLPVWDSENLTTAKVLQGAVKQVYGDTSGLNQAEQNGGQVLNASKMPVAGVSVSIPGLGYQTVTKENGYFGLPELPEKPVIAVFSKVGYLSTSVTLDRTLFLKKNPFFQVTLCQKGTELVLDDQWRHLGDNSYAPGSAGSMSFRQQGRNTTLVRHFQVNQNLQKQITLTIGSVVGLDTWQAHQAGQSQFHRYSTPMRVWLNGKLVGYVALNGDHQTLSLPTTLLRAGHPNQLVLETGYKVPETSQRDYDDMEFMLLTLSFPE